MQSSRCFHNEATVYFKLFVLYFVILSRVFCCMLHFAEHPGGVRVQIEEWLEAKKNTLHWIWTR